MSRRLFDADPFLRIKEYFHYDHATDTGWIETVEDETALVESNKRAMNASRVADSWGDGGELSDKNRVLALSATMTAELQRRGILFDFPKLMAWADTEEAIPYRRRAGRLKGTGGMV